MIRLFTLAVFAGLLASAPGRAHSNPVCGNVFERFLQGYSVGPTELKAFFEDGARIAACKKQLSADNLTHTLILGLIEMEGRDDPETARRHFAAACARGHVLGCVWEVMAELKAQKPRPRNSRIATYLNKFADSGLPVIDEQLGTAFLFERLEEKRELEPALRLLRRAADAGDFNARRTFLIFSQRARDESAYEARNVELGEHGYVPAWLKLANAALFPKGNRSRDPAAAIGWLTRAADAEPRFFRYEIARANYLLAGMIRAGDGTTPDPKEADRRLQHAASLGHAEARLKLHERDRLTKK